MAASSSFRFPACNFIKKENSAIIFFLWILQNSQEHPLTEYLWMTAFVFICKFWEVFHNISFIAHLLKPTTSQNNPKPA